MNVSGRQLANFLGLSARSIGRLAQAGVLEWMPDGSFALQPSVQRLLKHYSTRERWAFGQLRRFRMFDERTGDVMPEPRRRR